MSDNMIVIEDDIFVEERKKAEAEFRKIENMSDREREEYVENIRTEMKRLEKRYIAQYGEDAWKEHLRRVEEVDKEIEAESEEE